MMRQNLTSDSLITDTLRKAGVPCDVVGIVETVAGACRAIAAGLRNDGVTAAKSKNNFGDDVLSVDVMADKIISEALNSCQHVASYVSEESPSLASTAHSGKATHSVSYDPLDGSSIITSNFTVGSIFAVWPGNTPIGLTVRDMVASVVAVYGPRVVLFVGQEELGVAEFFCGADGEWKLAKRVWAGVCTPRTATVTAAGRGVKLKATVFSPGNLRAARHLPWYKQLITMYMQEGATLRYTGGMVPDVCQIIVKGDGIYMTPASPQHKMKLRLLFEAAPMAFLIHCAGGRSTTGLTNMMNVRVVSMEQTTPIALGCARDVERYERMCRGCSKL
ncbi:sedoheptulose-1,7-bisphosphatase [Trypanosoma brucei gambiense DAL972]|uniref:fructose-bisphosphatase n=3 Tax=Trypanosoma brucei TaxID=5691 RepID=C9ZJS1_TRYB9|nr:sedoheptulose-1,7-bisphosphatase [Trypanosoma brucei gambiense DAL972]RHW73987.1 sedoheptulose-1 [Trypanosoma brucei equiperdum]CAC70746.1 sedoheptulose-1,7-bisphosphatase [Trypanosoma brucei brucei]CBH09631.1 sedoheptulose-1,7-bisphosphatase [Trypanosoma brucei gambiense DAL972]|eukprot:XP_011771935.1 sedoheptulose-1,7-bisphosphatase [Trypanosoma brucei gambiense DAL972]